MADGDFRYLIVNPQRGGVVDIAKFLVSGNEGSFSKFVQSSADGVGEENLCRDDGVSPAHRWVIIVSIIARKIVAFFRKPMEWTGYVVEYILNLLSHNGNLIGLVLNFLLGKVVWPQRGSETFISAIGHIDGRVDLYTSDLLDKETGGSESGHSAEVKMANQSLMDLCIMASKLAYENANVVRNVVNNHWKMHFVDFYNCWNDYQKESSTQVFIMCDRPNDANLILVSFRGTEPFDADDWGTDFDYSWYEIPGVGKVHMGFLEALGLGNRMNANTFVEQLQVQNAAKSSKLSHVAAPSEGSDLSSSSFSDSDTLGGSDQSTDSEQGSRTSKNLVPQMEGMTAYHAVRSKLKSLLNEHKNAKFVVTGHSIGGALAIMFPVVLNMHQESKLLKRLLGVYTYGQPRIGNGELREYMEAHLEHPTPKYFRIVYSNDLVPRLPYDDKTFLYKHFGVCLYYNSLYIEQKVNEEPNPNYFGPRFLLPEYLNAFWEFTRSFIIGYLCGPEYKETWESTLLRAVGLYLPGISAHSPVDYVNSVRLGREKSY